MTAASAFSSSAAADSTAADRSGIDKDEVPNKVSDVMDDLSPPAPKEKLPGKQSDVIHNLSPTSKNKLLGKVYDEMDGLSQTPKVTQDKLPGKRSDGMHNISLTPKDKLPENSLDVMDNEVGERDFCTASLILFSSLAFYFSFIGSYDVRSLSESYIFASYTCSMFYIQALSSVALCLLLSSKPSIFGRILTVAVTGPYIIHVVTYGLLSLVIPLVNFPYTLDLVVGGTLHFLSIMFFVVLYILAKSMQKDPLQEVLLQAVTRIAVVTYIFGLLLQCIAAMVISARFISTLCAHITTINMLCQKRDQL